MWQQTYVIGLVFHCKLTFGSTGLRKASFGKSVVTTSAEPTALQLMWLDWISHFIPAMVHVFTDHYYNHQNNLHTNIVNSVAYFTAFIFTTQSSIMHRSRFAFLAAADLGIIATFLPWEKISVLGVVSETNSGTEIVESVLGTKGVGWISLLLFAIAAIICFAGKRALPISTGKKWTVMVMGLFSCIIGVHTYLDITQKIVLNPQESGGIMFESSAGSGIYIVIAAGLALVLLSLLFQKKEVV